MFNYEKANEILTELSKEADWAYNFPKTISRWEKVGLIASRMTDIPRDILGIIYTAFQEWNMHAENTFISVFFSRVLPEEKFTKEEIVDEGLLEKFSRTIPITDHVGDGNWEVVGKATVKIVVEYEELED